MYQKMTIIGIIMFCGFLVCGCTVAPKPVYQAVPVDGTGVWNNGQELVGDEQDGLEMVMAFADHRPGYLVFDVEFINHGAERVTIDPAGFFLQQGSVQPVEDKKQRFARDPEAALLRNDLAQSRAVARRESEKASDGFFDLAFLVADLTTNQSDLTEEQKQTRIQYDQEMELTRIREAQEHKATMQSLQRDEYRWQGQALRKTTLRPGQCIGGEVFFNPTGLEGPLDVSFPVGSISLNGRFILKKFLPTRPQRPSRPIEDVTP